MLYCDYNAMGSSPISLQTRLAQLVEQLSSKLKVIGSSPIPGKKDDRLV